MKKIIGVLLIIIVCRVSFAEDIKSAINDVSGRYIVEGAPPQAKDIILQDYKELKLKYSKIENRRVKEGDSWRTYDLTLVAFDEEWAWLAVVTQFKSKSWEYVERYRLRRNLEVDEEVSIPQIIEKQTKVVGGIKYGMSITDVFKKKGKHYKVNHHQAAGSADIVYDDITINVRDWWGQKGRVVDVKPTTEQMKKFMKDTPYEDEK